MPYKDLEQRKEYARKRYKGEIVPRSSPKLGVRATTLSKVGQKYGRLTVVSISGSDKYGAIFECLCDCGTKKLVSNVNLGRNTLSCGCLNREQVASKQVWQTEYNREIAWTKRRRKKIEYSLSLEQFTVLVQDNCAYCGVAPHRRTCVGKELRNGIDRVNNDIGYTLDNCVSCCRLCNRMKNDLSKDDFYDHINRILKYRIGP